MGPKSMCRGSTSEICLCFFGLYSRNCVTKISEVDTKGCRAR